MSGIILLTGDSIDKGKLNEKLLLQFPEDDGSINYAIYNKNSKGYAIAPLGEADAEGCGSFCHNLLSEVERIDEATLEYIIKASVYTLFRTYSKKLYNTLNSQRYISDEDKINLNDYIKRQIRCYDRVGCRIPGMVDLLDDIDYKEVIWYEDSFITVMSWLEEVVVTVNGTSKRLPARLLTYFGDKTLRAQVLELIIRYEYFNAFGVGKPSIKLVK